MYAPVCSQYPLDALPSRQLLLLHLDDEIKHCETLPISPLFFSQGGSQQFPVTQALFETIWQGNKRVHFAPVPDSRLVRIAEPEPRYPCIQIKSQTICLAFYASVVTCIRQHTNFQEGKWLEGLVGWRKL